MTTMLEALRAPFPPDVVHWRVGSTTKDKAKGMALAYIDARDVMARLDEVCGPGGWQDDFVPMSNGTTCCRIGILIDGQWVWKGDGAGATGNVENDTEREMALKGGYSDAFKRAAVKWGIGRYLYDLDSPWVELDEYKRIKKTELPKLKAALGGPAPKSAYQARKDGDGREYNRIETAIRAIANVDDLRAFWLEEQSVIAQMPPGWQEKLTDEKDRRKQELMARAAA